MAQANEQETSKGRGFEAGLRRAGQIFGNLSGLVKSLAAITVAATIIVAVAFGTETVRISGQGLEMATAKSSGPKRGAQTSPASVAASNHSTIYILFAPRRVRICPLEPGG